MFVFHKRDCSCGSRCIAEIKLNAEVKWNKYNDPTKKNIEKTSKNVDHCFTWTVNSNGLKNNKSRKNLDMPYITLWKPDLNEQKDFERLVFLTL